MYTIITILTILIYGPLSTLLHELGHVIPVLMLSNIDVGVSIGNGQNVIKSFKIGRLQIEIRKYSPTSGFCSVKGEITRTLNILLLIGGPLMSLTLFVLFMIVGTNMNDLIMRSIMNSVVIFELARVFITLMPMDYKVGYYKGSSSDGKRLMNILRRKSA